jgi:hypothetical protein
VTTKAQIFLSYAREDEAAVTGLYQTLSKAGFKPWLDIKDVLPGERWELAIKQALQKSELILLCLSKKSIRKRR